MVEASLPVPAAWPVQRVVNQMHYEIEAWKSDGVWGFHLGQEATAAG